MDAGHIAIVAPPTPGHLNPLQVLGDELHALGHRVTMVHVPGVERFMTSRAVGFSPVSGIGSGDMLDRYLGVLARPRGPIGLNRMIRATAAMSAALLDGLPEVLDRIGADAVIADSVEPAGGLVARHMGLPFVSTATALPLLRDPDVPPPFVGWDYAPGPRGRKRNRGGYAVTDFLMRPVRRELVARARGWGLAESSVDDLSPLLQTAQCPQAFDFPRSELPSPFRYGSPWRSAEDDLEPLAEDERRLVFCSLGTLQGSRVALFARMAEACAAVGARAVIAHCGALSEEQVARLPGDPLVRAFWPQTAVLRQCAAAVLHGGFNSVIDALAAGVPIVVVPIAFEQPATAARVAWTGAGRVVPMGRSSVKALTQAVRAVIEEPGYRAAASRLAATMDADGAARAAADVSQVLRDARHAAFVGS